MGEHVETSGKSTLPSPNPTHSFWLANPSNVLLGHHTTDALPTEADIVIVGSGISGASAARFLREDGEGKDFNIVMLEAREACWGATGRVSQRQLMEYMSKQDRMGVIVSHFSTLELPKSRLLSFETTMLSNRSLLSIKFPVTGGP